MNFLLLTIIMIVLMDGIVGPPYCPIKPHSCCPTVSLNTTLPPDAYTCCPPNYYYDSGLCCKCSPNWTNSETSETARASVVALAPVPARKRCYSYCTSSDTQALSADDEPSVHKSRCDDGYYCSNGFCHSCYSRFSSFSRQATGINEDDER